MCTRMEICLICWLRAKHLICFSKVIPVLKSDSGKVMH